MADDSPSFFSRWSQRKAELQAPHFVPERPVALPEPPVPTAVEIESPPPSGPAVATPEDPPPTLADVARLTRESDYAPFVARNVSPEVKNAALKRLFTDPHFNVMDGLDTYTGDFNTPDPLPPGMLRQMVQSQLLGLFDDEDRAVALAVDAPALACVPDDAALLAPSPAHEDPDLQLQPDDGAGRPDADAGTGPHAGCPH